MDKGYILKAQRILRGENLEILERGAVAVKDKKIEFVGSSEEAERQYPESQVFDLGNQTLMPGLIDCHSHTSMDARVDGHLEMMNDPAPELTMRAVRYVQDDLMSGITTARILGDKYYVDVFVRNAIDREEFPGPRLVVAGIGMRSIHGHGFVGVAHTGVQEFRKTCRENMLHKTQWLKVFVTAGAPPLNSSHIPSFISREEIETVTGEAKRMGICTSAHCIGGQGLVDCINGGIDVIDHAYCATDRDLELIGKNDRYICLTPSVFMDEERNKNNTAAVRKNTEAGREQVTKVMEKIVKSGVKYAIGSDALHGSMYLEAQYAVALGSSNLSALKGVTTEAAKLCRVEGETGMLVTGKWADMIGIDGNPLSDIGALKRVAFVMKQGRIYKNISGGS